MHLHNLRVNAEAETDHAPCNIERENESGAAHSVGLLHGCELADAVEMQASSGLVNTRIFDDSLRFVADKFSSTPGKQIAELQIRL